MKKIVLLFLLSCLVIAGCTDQSKYVNEKNGEKYANNTISNSLKEEKRLVNFVIQSEHIAKNEIDENIEQSIFVYLPPSYYESEKNYPVVYFLPGFGCSIGRITVQSAEELDALMSEQTCEEMIIVEVNGQSKLGGSFFVNSPVSGNWEDYIVYEVIPTVDKNFRTIPESNARGISGFSMGGFSCMNIAMKHPDVFSRVLSVAPGFLDENEFDIALESWRWDKRFLKSYGAAFSPNLELEYPYANIPSIELPESESEIIEDWKNGFGYWENKISKYLELNHSLTGIHIVYGSNDSYKWITSGCEHVSSLLLERNIDHTISVNTAGHTIPENFITDEFAPFFSELKRSN